MANTGQNINGNSESGGCGCWFILTLVVLAVVAIYFAVIRAADFPGAAQIRDAATAGQSLYARFHETDIEGEITGLHDTEDEQKVVADPTQRHLELKQLMLKFTNRERIKASVPPVKSGSNPAAQLHAEASLAGCYSAHWDEWGLKPNHRYTLTGGTGADGENGSGSDYCIKPSENYRPIDSMEGAVAETVQGRMESPGHRRNLLNPAHTVLNVGIAYDRFNQVMVQQFASDYVTYSVRPNIDPDGILRLKGIVSGATLNIWQTANVQIYYDPPPKPLTRGQLGYTYSLCSPIQVAYIEKPLIGGSFYTDPAVKQEMVERRCIDPYPTVQRPTAMRKHTLFGHGPRKTAPPQPP